MKMKQWIIIIILMLAMSGIVAATECAFSIDNSSWININSSTGGFIDEDGQTAGINFLNKSTTFYFRCKTAATSWSYLSQKTDEAVDEMEIAMVVGIVALAFFFLYFAFKLDDNHFFLKILLIFFAITTILVIPNALMTGETGSANNILINLTTWFFRIFVIYFGVFIFWHWAKKSEKIIAIIDRLKMRK